MTAPCYFSLEEGELEKAAGILIKRSHILGTSCYNRFYRFLESSPKEDEEINQIGALLSHWHTVGLIDVIKLQKRMNDEVWEEIYGG